MEMMYWVRTIAWHALILLQSVSTLVAGTPQVRCRCSYFATPAPTSPVCCCEPAKTQAETPSCCSAPADRSAPSNDGAPAAGDRPCQKTIMSPAAAMLERSEIKSPTDPGAALGVMWIAESLSQVGMVRVSLTPFRAPPAPDLQLLFEHFVI